jgi:hypothetical protein
MGVEKKKKGKESIRVRTSSVKRVAGVEGCAVACACSDASGSIEIPRCAVRLPSIICRESERGRQTETYEIKNSNDLESEK